MNSKPSIKNITVLIVSYNPDNRLKKSVNVLRQIGLSKIVIVDNSDLIYASSLELGDCTTIIENKKNLGIAKALNLGFEYIRSTDAKWVLTLDQDSLPIGNILDIYSQIYKNYKEKSYIGQIGVSYSNADTVVDDVFDVTFKKVKTLITSGTLVSIKAYGATDGFNNDLFIDSVDLDFNLKLLISKYVSLKSNRVGLIHECGVVKTKRFLFFLVSSSNHNEKRRYFMARNHIIITKKYLLKFPMWILKKNYFFLVSIIKLILVEDNRSIKLKNILKGIVDGC